MDALPCAAQYETSYAHRAVVTHAVVAAKAGFLCTASEDGHVKFWKKMQRGVEFVKHFHAHVGPVQAMGCWSLVNIALNPAQKRRLLREGGLAVVVVWSHGRKVPTPYPNP